MFVCAIRYISAVRMCVHVWVRVWAPLHATGRHVYIRGVREGPQTNRKQAFFIHPSILDACLTYEAWFGATLARVLFFFFFFPVVAFSVLAAYTRIVAPCLESAPLIIPRCHIIFTDFSDTIIESFSAKEAMVR